MRYLFSDKTLAPLTKSVRPALVVKYLQCPQYSRSQPRTTSSPMTVTSAEVKEVIRSFAPGSAGGKDGLRTQHLKYMRRDRVRAQLNEDLMRRSWNCKPGTPRRGPRGGTPAYFGVRCVTAPIHLERWEHPANCSGPTPPGRTDCTHPRCPKTSRCGLWLWANQLRS